MTHADSQATLDAPPPARVLVAMAMPGSAALRMGTGFPGISIDLVDSSEAAVERAMSIDYQAVLLDLALDGIGAVAAADILRRAGAPCALVAVGKCAPGSPSDAVFDHCLSAPLSGAEIAALMASMGPPSHRGGALGEDWIARECADLVAQFRSGLPAAAAALRAALEQRDMAALKSMAHALKGSAGAYGLASVTERCSKIESEIRAGHFDAASAEAASLVDALEHEFDDWQTHG